MILSVTRLISDRRSSGSIGVSPVMSLIRVYLCLSAAQSALDLTRVYPGSITCDAWRLRVHHVAQERLEHHQRPQRRAVITQPRLVIVHQPAQVRRIEPAGLGEHWPKHGLLD